MATRQQYLVGLRSDMRAALAQFRHFDQKWNQLNDSLNIKFQKEGKDIIAVARAKEVNITLQGHMSAATWWRAKAEMLANVIQAEECFDRLMRTP